MTTTTGPAVESTPLVRWLHLTDLHIGNKDESQGTALASLLNAIEASAEGKPFDMVLLTGDLAFSGLGPEYSSLESQLLGQLRAHRLCAGARFFAVPGNHDMDCAVGWPPVWKQLGKPRQEKFFNLDDAGRSTRAMRAGAFANYRDFLSKAGIESVNPVDSPAAVFHVLGKKKPIAIISAVTAYFADKDVPDHHRTSPAPIHPIRTLLQSLPNDVQPLVLGHHPPDWFTQETEDQLHSLLVERNALYLHGHEHRVRSRMGARGVIALGFGAAYPGPIDGSATSSRYRNSFAICEIADSLHVAIVSWDAEHGKWRSDQKLPGDFIDRSERLKDGYRLELPTTRLLDRPSLSSAIRNEFVIDRCIWLAEDQPKRWANLLLTIGALRNIDELFALPNQSLPAGHCQFRIKDDSSSYLVYGIAAEGDILTYDQLQTINTELDKQSYSGCIVATLGELAADAKTLAAQLAKRKPLVVYERTDLVRRSIRNLPPELDRALSRADPKFVAAMLVVTQEGLALIFQDVTGNAWFQVIGPAGAPLPESSPLVVSVRKELLSLRSMHYEAPGATERGQPVQAQESQQFDKREYLSGCHAYFENVRYAPLAALGLRFKNAPLSEIYVDASADVGGTSKASQNLTRAVSEFVESLNLPQTQREQLESQLRSRLGLNRTAEVGAASKLYQRYNNIVVLGDPGSGKTCFVQHEILAYCRPPLEDGSWYGQHLPIYISLAEAARVLETNKNLLEVCSIVSARRGIALPRNVIENALSEGRAAFFFDGLDEVGYIDKRIALLSEIDRLVKSFAARGNRFILTSRPAAVQPVDIPEAMTFLQLKGLTSEEIRILAGRVLTTRLGSDDGSSLAEEEMELIDRLLEDTRTTPGIARIARNPLLLTLLVLIYANTGALSARRHVIYTQAIKTLVSVRGRQTREQQLSEADLRTRLGALALAIFQRDIAEIPRRTEVVEVLSPLIAAPASPSARKSKSDLVDGFLQEVAEATGLLTIHTQSEKKAEDLITFMHYSFLEYYAAAGLLSRGYKDLVAQHCGNPRWKDVTTLLFGILSEQSDVTPLLERILSNQSAAEAITQYKTLLALDCAAECDVPPESSQDLLASCVFDTVASGTGRYSADVRGEIAHRLEYFIQGAGQRLEDALAKGLRHSDPLAAAAFADLLGHVSEAVPMSGGIAEAFAKCLDHTNATTRAAALLAIERRSELRSEKAKEITRQSLKGSVIEKHAALKVIAAVPMFQEHAKKELRDLLADPNPLISTAAAQCVLFHSLRGDKWREDTALLETVLAKLNQSTQDTGLEVRGITLDREIVRQLVLSTDANEAELAIRSLPLVRDDDQFVYQTLQQCLKTTMRPRHKAACLEAFRLNAGAIDLITLADTDVICGLLKAAERNVRLSAIRLLGAMPDDEQVVRSLQDHLKEGSSHVASDEEEISETAKALAKHVRRNERLQDETLSAVLQLLPKRPEDGFGNDERQHQILALLVVCESIGGMAEENAISQIYSFAISYKTPLPIRRQSIRVFGRLAEPSEQNVKRILELLGHNDVRINDATFAATASFVGQCRRKVEYVRRVYRTLNALRDQLCVLWKRELAKNPLSIDPAGLREIRDAVVEIDNLVLAYEEFSGRAKVAS
jgi:hypothetical protein